MLCENREDDPSVKIEFVLKCLKCGYWLCEDCREHLTEVEKYSCLNCEAKLIPKIVTFEPVVTRQPVVLAPINRRQGYAIDDRQDHRYIIPTRDENEAARRKPFADDPRKRRAYIKMIDREKREIKRQGMRGDLWPSDYKRIQDKVKLLTEEELDSEYALQEELDRTLEWDENDPLNHPDPEVRQKAREEHFRPGKDLPVIGNPGNDIVIKGDPPGLIPSQSGVFKDISLKASIESTTSFKDIPFRTSVYGKFDMSPGDLVRPSTDDAGMVTRVKNKIFGKKKTPIEKLRAGELDDSIYPKKKHGGKNQKELLKILMKECYTTKEVAKWMGVQQVSAFARLARLEEKGLVHRKYHPKNKKQYWFNKQLLDDLKGLPDE